MHSSRRRAFGSLLLLVSCLVTAACTPVAVIPEDYANAKALLDIDNEIIDYPLESYALDGREMKVVEHANALLVADCMSEAGLDYPRVTENWDTKRLLPDRMFGIWSPEQAANYGYDIPEDPQSTSIDELEAKKPESWWATWQGCADSVKQIPLSVPFSTDAMTPVDRGLQESSQSAKRTAEWAAAYDEWTSCLAEADIKIGPDSKFVPELTDSAQTNIEIAIQDVACKESTQLVQRLANIISTFQAAYIQAHESELEAFRDEVDANLEEAREIVATYGG